MRERKFCRHLLRAQSASRVQSPQNVVDRHAHGISVLGDELAAFLRIFHGVANFQLPHELQEGRIVAGRGGIVAGLGGGGRIRGLGWLVHIVHHHAGSCTDVAWMYGRGTARAPLDHQTCMGEMTLTVRPDTCLHLASLGYLKEFGLLIITPCGIKLASGYSEGLPTVLRPVARAPVVSASAVHPVSGDVE